VKVKFENVLIEAVQKTNEYISLFLTLEEQPERILTDIFSGESDNFFTRIIESSQELTGEMIQLHDLQDELYRILIPYVQTYAPKLELIYNADTYPSPIHIFDGDREIGRLNIYEKIFEVVPHEAIQKEGKYLKRLEKEFEENTEELKRHEDYLISPTSYGDTPFKKMQIALRKGHYEKEIKGNYQDLLNLSMEIEQNLISQRLRMERVQQNLEPYEDMQYAIAKPFMDKFKYEVRREEPDTD
jgi:hypothetical protein